MASSSIFVALRSVMGMGSFSVPDCTFVNLLAEIPEEEEEGTDEPALATR